MSVSGLGCAPVELYLQKQVVGQIWPEGHSLLTTGVESCRQKIGRPGIVKPGPRRGRWSRSCLWIWKEVAFGVCVCFQHSRFYAMTSTGEARTRELDPSKKGFGWR